VSPGRPANRRPEARETYGFWRVLGEGAPRYGANRPRVRVECTGPFCEGERRTVDANDLIAGRTRSCKKCGRRIALRNGFGMGGSGMGARE